MEVESDEMVERVAKEWEGRWRRYELAVVDEDARGIDKEVLDTM